MGQKLGDASNPLLLSVRSGAKFSMPGMMNTILNLGLNDETTAGLAEKSGNERFAYDCYRRFIQMFGEVALDIHMEKFDHIFDARKAKAKAKLDTDLTADDLKAIIADYKKLVQKETGKPFPEDPREQLSLARDAVFGSLVECQGDVLPQHGKDPGRHRHRGQRAGHGVRQHGRHFGHRRWLHARSRFSGEKVFYGEFLMNAQGEDVVAGIRTPHPIADLRKFHARSLRAASRDHDESRKALQRHAGFRVHHPGRKLYMLQTRNGKRTGPAAVRIAVAMVEEGMITKKDAILRVAPYQLDQLLHPVFDPKTSKS